MSSAVYFASPDEFRAWLAESHDSHTELLVGFYKKSSGRASITWEESVDEALCFGWIDGVRRRVDDERYTIRFTPRKPGSIWSARNIERVAALIEQGRMQPSGLRAFEERDRSREVQYSYENEHQQFDPESQSQFEACVAAWDNFCREAPWYRKAATWWVMSAKRESTRASRLATLIADSERGERVKPLRRST